MIKLAFVRSVSKKYLSMQQSMRRNQKLWSSIKLVFTLVLFLWVLSWYAVSITIASTKGYFHRQESRINDDLVFERSIIDLELLQLEKELLSNIGSVNGQRYWSTNRMEIVTTYENELAYENSLTEEEEIQE